MKKYIIVALLLFVGFNAVAQDTSNLKAGEKYAITEADYANNTVEMADLMRSNGKIYVVVGVILIIFAGIVFYMVKVDRKLSKIEGEVFKEKVNS
ncbi:MAG: hypothetical protein Roseis2KO_21930 [Roseivirga sp.]